MEPSKVIGSIIGEYSLGKTLQRSVLVKTCMATHIPTQREVVMKLVKKQQIIDSEIKNRLQSHIQILRFLRHPFIPQLYQIIETSKVICLAMEFVDNGELSQEVTRCGRMSELGAGQYFWKILNALDYLHQAGIAHRGISLGNILLDKNHNIKLIDFSLAQVCAQGSKLNTICGSIAYLSPEILSGQAYDPFKGDVWACGVLLYAMIIGKLPFEHENNLTLCKKIVSGNYHLPEWVSLSAVDLFKKILNPNPQKRATLKDIQSHRFFTCREPLIQGIRSNPYPFELEQSIILYLQSKGYTKQTVRQSILANNLDKFSAYYFILLAEKLEREGMSLAKYYLQRKFSKHMNESHNKSRNMVSLSDLDPGVNLARKRDKNKERKLSDRIETVQSQWVSGNQLVKISELDLKQHKRSGSKLRQKLLTEPIDQLRERPTFYKPRRRSISARINFKSPYLLDSQIINAKTVKKSLRRRTVSKSSKALPALPTIPTA